MKSFAFFATAAKGIETLLLEELAALGSTDVKETRAGVHFSGSLEQAYRTCLWSRLANRILLPIAKFHCLTDEYLYREVKAIDWQEHMDVHQTLAVDASVINSTISHSQYAALKTKDAVVDYFRELTGERPSIETDRPDIQINLYLNNDNAQVYIDLSGESLHQRGYRTRGSAAPLKENLAAAILYRAGWPEVYKSGGAFVDFMCGSGTLPIEAAMMACDIAPGINRDYFGFLGWRQHDETTWQVLKEEAARRRAKGLEQPPAVFGFDHHRDTIKKTIQHVSQAGLENVVQIEYQDVFSFDAALPDFKNNGLVVLNPPYGKRLGQEEQLEPLYKEIGNVLNTRFKGFKAAVFVDDQAKGKAIGFRARKIHSLFNGAIPCKLLHFDINDESTLRDYRLPKLLEPEALSEQSRGFENRLNKNLKQLKKWAANEGISCYRIYDADLPDYSVAIDLYESDQTWINIQEYEAPKTIDPDKARHRLREVVTIVLNVMQLDSSALFLKRRRRQRGDAQYEKLADEQNFRIVQEAGCKFWINLEDYLDTGLFLDHRPMREEILSDSRGKSFLNLFAYTGSFSVCAAMGGARRTLTVDMSKTYLDWAKRNMQLNGAEAEFHRFLQTDCLSWLEHPTEKKRYDIIFLAPPSFSNSKRMKQVFDIQKDHVRIIRQSMKLLEEDGVLFFSTNLRGFRLDEQALDDISCVDITDRTIPFDFKQRKHVHRCWKLRQMG